MALKPVVWCAAAAAACVLTAARVDTQSAVQDIGPALLTEVRALRTTIATVASVGASGQLLLGRLQIQEQRVTAMAGRLEAVRTQITDLKQEADALREQCATLETKLKAPPSSPSPFPDHYEPSREVLEDMLKETQGNVARSVAEVERLTAIEAALAADLGTEQARWAELNRRLEEIERILRRQD